MQVLLVGQVIEPFQQLVLLLRVQTLLVTGPVVEPAPHRVDDLEEDEGTVGAQQSLDGGEIPRGLRGQEQMGTDDVSAAVEAKEEAYDGRSLGVARRVDARERPA